MTGRADQPPYHRTAPPLGAWRRTGEFWVRAADDLRYTQSNGGYDYVSWRGTLAAGLTFLLGSAP